MNILIIADMPPRAAVNVKAAFPLDWTVNVVRADEAGDFLAKADVLIPEHVKIDAAFLKAAPRLKLVQTGAGYDNVDLAACASRGVFACNAAGVNAVAVAEHTLALMLCWFKNITYLDSFMKAGRDERELDYAGGELEGRTIGLVGLGAIGSRVARACAALGMRVLAFSRSGRAAENVSAVSFERLLAESDVLSLHLPLNNSTRGLMNAERFAAMKPAALFVNTSRGGLVDEQALIAALKSGRLGGACLDVYAHEPLAPDSELRRLPRVVLTPHTAGLPDGVKFHRKRYEFFVSNIRRVAEGKRPENLLNG